MKNNQRYLSEEKYIKIRKILIIIGLVSLCIGVTLFVSSFFIDVPKMGEEGWFEAEQQKSILRFLAFPFGLVIPILVFSIAFKREMAAFTAQQNIPIVNESIEKISPSVGNAAKEIAKGIKDGLKDNDE